MNDQTQENAERRIAQLEQQIAALSKTIEVQRPADLQQTITDLRRTIQVMEDKDRLEAQVGDAGEQTTRLSYQQGADWVRMCNSISWSLGSIYVVAAIIALNGAMQQGVKPEWRTVIGWVVVFLALAWALIDGAYLWSARTARNYLRSIENKWAERPYCGGFFAT